MRLFLISSGNVYILLVVNYVPKWVEAVPTRTNKARARVNFLRDNIFFGYCTPYMIINHQGTNLND